MKGAKKDKKNGKEGGGVVAAVTKHAAGKFANNHGNANKGSASETSSPSHQSPDIKPTAIPSSGNPNVSPYLDAVSGTSYTTSTAPSTNEWIRGVPGLGSSPGNLISLQGESPPTQPSSYEDPRAVPYGWSSPRPYHSAQPASASPPNPARRPLSFHMDTHRPSSEAYAPSAASVRRSSMNSPYAFSRASGAQNPPLPHQSQQHFYAPPEIDLDFGQQAGMRPGDRNYAFGFDTIPSLNGHAARGKDTVVVAGYEGGLEVYSVTKTGGLDPLASLKGLRGGVYHAKILPWTCTVEGESDPSPLVALVVHGPVLPHLAPDINVEGDGNALQDRSQAASPVPTDMGLRDGMGGRYPCVDYYQTSVEVYSLKDSRCVGVLLKAMEIKLNMPITSPMFKAPPPTGAFRILADTGTVVVSSGETGESWIYQQASIPHEPGLEFRCVGKLWTALQQPLKDQHHERDRSRGSDQRQITKAPIIALKGRYIAYCPAMPSSQVSLKPPATAPIQGKTPGLSTVTPPQLPGVVSDVELPAGDSVMNKIMRETTQELIQGARWVSERGLQAWSNYWNKSSATSQQARSPPPTNSQPWNAPYTSRSEPSQFPPTHGTMTPVIPKEPGLVSIIDVETSLNSASIHPISTFSTSGCSFLSFAPNGLSMFMASSKGDVQIVLDLMRIQCTKSSPLQTSAVPNNSPTGPRVRQIHQFSRMTVARIVDVSWTKPNGECIAMVTERGTVHLLDLPTSAFAWPPPRRRIAPRESAASPSEGGGSAVSMAAGALSSAMDAARPLINRSRRSSSNTPHTTGSRIVESANYGGKMIAAGISHSLGKTGNAISQLRHNGDNRISLPSSSVAPGPSCVILVGGRRSHSLFVLGEGLVRIFPQRPRNLGSASGKQRAPRFNRYKDLKLPMLPDDVIAASVKRYIDPDEYLDLMEKESDGANNTMVLNARPLAPKQRFNIESSIPQAEIESSAPYQPFHTDRRVALFEYGANPAAETAIAATTILPSVSVLLADTHLDSKPDRPSSSRRKQKAGPRRDDEPATETEAGAAWAFGQAMERTRLDTGHVQGAEADASSFSASADDPRALPQSAMERSILRQHREGDGDNDDEQIVVTTRRRRGGGRSNGDADDDGFFEDDCEVLDFADQRV